MSGANEEGGAPHTNPEMIDRIVTAWLKKRGFSKAEKALRTEMRAHSLEDLAGDEAALFQNSIQNMILFHEAGDANTPARYNESFSELKEWVEKSLDRYKTELMAVLYPLYVHSVLDLLEKGFPEEAGAFLNKHKSFAGDHVDVLNKLKALQTMASNGGDLQKLSEAPEYVALRKQKIPVALSSYAFRLLFMWLLEARYLVMLAILNAYVDIKVVSAVPDAEGQDLRFFEANASSNKPFIWGRLGALIPRPLAAGEASSGPAATAKRAREEEQPTVQVKSEIPLPPGLPLNVVEAQEQDALIAASKSGKSLPSIAMLTFYHTYGDLNCVAMSADGSLVAAGLGDSSARLWDLKADDAYKAQQSGAAVAGDAYYSLIGHSGPVFGASFSPCNRYLLTGSEDSTVRLWALETKQKNPLVVYRGHNFPVWNVAFSPLGYYFATASHDHTARIFTTDNVFPVRILAGHLTDVDAIAWHPNCNYIATGSADNTIRLWEVNTGECVRILTGHYGPIYDLAFSPDGSMLASAGDDSTVGIWDLGTQKGIAVLRGHTKTAWSLSYSPNGNVLATGGGDGKVILWDVQAALAERKGLAKAGEHMLGSYSTKKTPVSKVQFTRRNLLLAAGEFSAQ